ncbi:hypothetical protein Hte_008978 [Hypoxylon texense]
MRHDVIAPRIRSLNGPRDLVAVGKTFIVHVLLGDESHVTVDCKAGNVVLVEYNQSEEYFEFYSIKHGKEAVSFSFAPQGIMTYATGEIK